MGGENDIVHGVPAEQVARKFRELFATLQAEDPDLRIYFLSIKSTTARWSVWAECVRADRLIEISCERHPQLVYIDVASPLLDSDGLVRDDLFQPDGIHLNRDGYLLWRDAIRPVLVSAEESFEYSCASLPPILRRTRCSIAIMNEGLQLRAES